MTLDEIERYAEIGYGSGLIKPMASSCSQCVLGAAVYGFKKKFYTKIPGSFAYLLGIKQEVSEAIQQGFDKINPSKFADSEAYKFGQRMAEKFLPSAI